MVLENFQCQGIKLILITEGQGPTVLAVGVGGNCLEIFLWPIIFLFLFPFSGRQLNID